jgi:hypothetical protein
LNCRAQKRHGIVRAGPPQNLQVFSSNATALKKNCSSFLIDERLQRREIGHDGLPPVTVCNPRAFYRAQLTSLQSKPERKR